MSRLLHSDFPTLLMAAIVATIFLYGIIAHIPASPETVPLPPDASTPYPVPR